MIRNLTATGTDPMVRGHYPGLMLLWLLALAGSGMLLTAGFHGSGRVAAASAAVLAKPSYSRIDGELTSALRIPGAGASLFRLHPSSVGKVFRSPGTASVVFEPVSLASPPLETAFRSGFRRCVLSDFFSLSCPARAGPGYWDGFRSAV